MGERVIGERFRIEDTERDLLGRGGMGEVYRATDLQTGQVAAVKALKPEIVANHPEVVDRFVQEGEALRQLDHPNIVKMLAAVEEGGRYYLAVEYIGGGSLQNLLDRAGRLAVDRAVEIALDVADALTRAHRLGIVHRDLKPGNVLLDEQGIPHLTDFGLARVVGTRSTPRSLRSLRSASPASPASPARLASSESTPLTEPGLVVGTLDYLSPEACQGQPLDARTDIWSFGVMLYEMLTGELPFQGETVVALLTAILTQPIPDLSARRPGVPDALADLIYRMLEKDRAQRIPSVRLVGAELEAIASGVALAHKAALERRFVTPGSPRPAARGPRHNLPAQPIPFVGREAELAELDRMLVQPADAGSRLVTVTGAGGMGKTRLALEAAAGALDHFPDGVFFVPLASLVSADALVPAIAEVLGLTFYGQGDPRRQLLDYLHGKTMLLLLDNFEHVLAYPTSPGREEPGLGAAGLVADILAAAPAVKVLVTSRVKLNLQGEQVFFLSGMTDKGSELFVQGARRANPRFALSPADAEHVTRICQLVEGMPLGILLAAAWTEVLGPAEIEGEIARSYDFLESSLADLPERQRSLRAVFDYSWRLLTPRERDTLQQLSVFRGGLTREAAQQVTGASLRELMALTGKSLLYREPTGRYQVHNLLRQYAADRLDEAPDEARAAHDRHAGYYIAALAAWGADLWGARQQEAMAAIETEDENARTAWTWAARQGQVDRLVQAADALGCFYEWRGRYQEGEADFRLAAEETAAGRDRGQTTAITARSRVLAWQSVFERALGQFALNEQLLAEALALVEQAGAGAVGDRPEQAEKAFVRLQMGHSYARAGDYKEARRQYAQSLVLYRALNEAWGTANALSGLGLAAYNLSNYDEARRVLDEALALYRSLGDRRGTADALRSLGTLALAQAQTDEGAAFLKESTTLRKEIGDRPSLAQGLVDWASMLNYSGEFDRSHELIEEALAIYQDLGNRPSTAILYADLANSESHRGHYDHARTYSKQALALAREIGDRGLVARTLFVLGGVLLAAGQPAEGRPLLWESSELYRAGSQQNGLAISLGTLGGAALQLGDLAAARQHLTEALRVAVALRTFVPKTITLAMAARLLAEQGQVEQAVELYALLERYPFVARSSFFDDTAGRPVAAAAAGALAPDVAAAARELGQARDLEATASEVLAELETWKPFLTPFPGLTGTKARGRGPM